MPGKISRLLFLILTACLVLSLVACQKKEEPAAPKPVRISTTAAYEKYFGPAPTTDKGTCFAFVIYFPSAREPGKVVPFPFFTFDQGSIRKVAVERLLGGMDVGSYAGEFLLPFPAGTHLLGVSEEKGAVTVSFSKEMLSAKSDEESGKAALNALALTLVQFPGTRDLRLQVEGRNDKMPLKADDAAILQPSPPRLLSVTAVKDKGTKNVEEVSAYFDRPVDIQAFTMTDSDGKPLAGDMFHSVFDMAAVLKPKDPTLFREKMPVKVSWKVTDKVGRHAEGEGVWPLEVREH